MGAGRSRRCCPQQQQTRQCGRNLNVYHMPQQQCPQQVAVPQMMPVQPMMAPPCGGYGGAMGFDGGLGALGGLAGMGGLGAAGFPGLGGCGGAYGGPY